MGNLRCPDHRAIRLCQPRRPSLAHYGLDARRSSRPKHGRLRHNLDWRVLHRRLRKHIANLSASPPLRFLRVKRRRPQRHLHLDAGCRSVGGPPADLKAVVECNAPIFGRDAPMARPPVVWHPAAQLSGLFGCFRFWEIRSWGGWEMLATKNTKLHKESAQHAPLR